ncbi:MAG: hypothetical protein QM621_04010 [Aeromicrobium sp.]|uniref:DUF7507 domain-containing protein n=1 Tax=Aeromicrobium sp. TaxID=1871063 RepID=UPI0039E29D8D
MRFSRRSLALTTAAAVSGASLAFLGGALPASAAPVVLGQAATATCSDEQARGTERWWFFGDGAGLDFGASGDAAPTAVSGSGATPEGGVVVTDTGGNLQFWSNGQTVVGRDQQVMPNGTFGAAVAHSAAVQPVVAFPSTTQAGTYFVVTTTGDDGSTTGQLFSSVVDMSLNDGLGDVSSAPAPLGAAGTAGESLAAVPDADGTGYWVLTSQNSSPNLHAFYFDGAGPADPDGSGPLGVGDPVTSVMPTDNYDRYSSLVFSADRSQLVQTSASGPAATDPSVIRRLSFDPATGQIAQLAQWSGPAGGTSGLSLYNAEFSPSGRYLYVTKLFTSGAATARVWRYDLQATTATPALQPIGVIDPADGGGDGGAIRRGPDGRMYVARNGETQIAVIADPDNEDRTQVGFDATALALADGAVSGLGLPQTVVGCPDPPSLDLVTQAVLDDLNGNGVADVGETIAYSFTVTNTGNSSLRDVAVTDPRLTGLSPLTSPLAPGEVATFQAAAYTVTEADLQAGSIVSHATARGVLPGTTAEFTATDDATVATGTLDDSATPPANSDDATDDDDAADGVLPVTGAGVSLSALLLATLALAVGVVVVRRAR